jgi:hypothetical protein
VAAILSLRRIAVAADSTTMESIMKVRSWQLKTISTLLKTHMMMIV